MIFLSLIMNSIYLYLQRIMIRAVTPSMNITRKQALYIISRYLKFIIILKEEILRDMIELKLLERVNRDNLKIINQEKSEIIESGVLIKLIESGDYREEYQREYQKSYRNRKKKAEGRVLVFV